MTSLNCKHWKSGSCVLSFIINTKPELSFAQTPKKFNNKSGLVTIPSLCSPPPPYMSWMEGGGKKKFDSHQWTWSRSSLGITMREQWCIGNHSTTLGSLENTAESQNTICHLSKQKQNEKANNPKPGSVFLPIKPWFREKRWSSLPDRIEYKWDGSFLGSQGKYTCQIFSLRMDLATEHFFRQRDWESEMQWERQHAVLLDIQSIKNLNYLKAHYTSSGDKRFKSEASFSLLNGMWKGFSGLQKTF